MTHVTCRPTAKNRDQLRNPTLGNRVWASFTFLFWNTVLSLITQRTQRLCTVTSRRGALAWQQRRQLGNVPLRSATPAASLSQHHHHHHHHQQQQQQLQSMSQHTDHIARAGQNAYFNSSNSELASTGTGCIRHA